VVGSHLRGASTGSRGVRRAVGSGRPPARSGAPRGSTCGTHVQRSPHHRAAGHGFICANGRRGRINVGPDSGSVVTLLPADSDASADMIRAAVRDALGVDVAVLISDSFGRPWRWGITDVADRRQRNDAPGTDLRGNPDADGRIMRSTVRATADEIATAAELALRQVHATTRGRRARRPPNPRRGRIADVLMPRDFDLFK